MQQKSVGGREKCRRDEAKIRMLSQRGGDARDMNREIIYGVNNAGLYSAHGVKQHIRLRLSWPTEKIKNRQQKDLHTNKLQSWRCSGVNEPNAKPHCMLGCALCFCQSQQH